MEGIFIGVLCLSGCLTFSTCLLHQYHFVSDKMNWTEAQSYCRETYTDLATIENTEEMKKLNDTVSAAGNSSKVWIGLYSHIDWKWSDGFNQSGAEYRNWKSPDPNYIAANELCVLQGSNYGRWYDYDCHSKIPFVCYNGTLEDSDFVLVNTSKNWTEAQRHCREHYTDLVTVRNNADRDKIRKLITSLKMASIGLYRDPQIYWSDGSNYSFSSWYQGCVRKSCTAHRTVSSTVAAQWSGGAPAALSSSSTQPSSFSAQQLCPVGADMRGGRLC
ncbi:C-type mannose receptor 2-like [Hippoglossus stenolepis]|uniref:C-type mannose receptor 2-like n=1 Tax=Hippoglossus stenolepis TaxID=195615 RepID=UPI001FAEFADE|nr:C-type mannose receptor 2-like [Hippoglossus stenolepis]